MNRRLVFTFLVLMILALPACSRNKVVCPEDAGQSDTTLDWDQVMAAAGTPAPETEPIPMKIGWKTVMIDRVVSGPVCNDRWEGTVYVGCDIQVRPWDEAPLFFEDCDLEIDESAVVYVAIHNNEPFYKGCSCHTGELYEEVGLKE